MERRVRTTKNLAKRMDLQYFKHPHPLRRLRLWLSILIPLVAIGWFVVQRANSQKIYSSGPLSVAHAVLGKQCNVCHVTTLGLFRAKVSDDTCLKCHDAPAHHADKITVTVTCSSCHIEHRGSFRLANTADASCTQCHANLLTRSVSLQYARVVKDFDKQHPEFAALRPGGIDPGQIKLNHYAHLRPNLAGPTGPVQMECQDCHRATAIENGWPYSMSGSGPNPIGATGTDMGLKHLPSRDYMAPILYVNQCAGCHAKDLQFDQRFDQVAPHDKPEIIQEFLVKKYNDYFATHPRALAETVSPDRISSVAILSNTTKITLPAPRNRQEWIDQQVTQADRLLFDKGCKLCHVMIDGNGPLPTVAKSSIPARWFPHAEFSHDSHRLLTCTACHNRAPESRQTGDILLPGIASCRSCHEDSGARHDAASGRCSECHAYHDWTKERPTKGKFTIPELRAATSR
jgi:cytochrome c7-like protein